MKMLQTRGYVKRAPGGSNDDSGRGILNALEAVNRRVWQAVE